jgi:hypothetical protein
LDQLSLLERSSDIPDGSPEFPYVDETGLGSAFQGNHTLDDIFATTLSEDHEHVCLKNHENINHLSGQVEELVVDLVIRTSDH